MFTKLFIFFAHNYYFLFTSTLRYQPCIECNLCFILRRKHCLCACINLFVHPSLQTAKVWTETFYTLFFLQKKINLAEYKLFLSSQDFTCQMKCFKSYVVIWKPHLPWFLIKASLFSDCSLLFRAYHVCWEVLSGIARSSDKDYKSNNCFLFLHVWLKKSLHCMLDQTASTMNQIWIL